MLRFNLDKTLSGHPVKLRNGDQAFVKYILNDKDQNVFDEYIYILRGYRIKPNLKPEKCSWTKEGYEYERATKAPLDIIGLWEEE